jgi:hypothetical protein
MIPHALSILNECDSRAAPDGRAVAGMKKWAGREKLKRSPSETKNGHRFVPQSPFVNLAGDAFFGGSSDCCPAAGGEHV